MKPLFCFVFSLIFAVSNAAGQKTFPAQDYYALRAGSEWRYNAPPTRAEGDYVSTIAAGDEIILKAANSAKNNQKILTFRHFDATRAAKVLAFVPGEGLYYLRDEFAGGDSYADFDQAVLWFPAKFKIGQETIAETGFTRRYKNGTEKRGAFKLVQKIARLETVETTAGEFRNCLRVEWETLWDLGDGKRARSVNVYHYAKNTGVVKASARFIVSDADSGKELINRLVETDLKSALVNGRRIESPAN